MSEVATIRSAARALRAGGIVVMPTDTVYGLAADPSRADAVGALYALKGRDDGKPIALLAADTAAVDRFGCRMTRWERALACRYWPGPLTLVLRTACGTEGFRVPDCNLTRAILRAAGGVLRVTSANRSGEADARTLREALDAVGEGLDYAVDGGPVTGGVPSTVVRMEGRRLGILREGALCRAELEACLQEAACGDENNG